MLDIEVVTAPTKTVFDIVSLDDFFAHVRASPTLRRHPDFIARATAALEEAADECHGFQGILNRMVFPCQLRMWLTRFPDGPIQLPFPELISVVSLSYGSTTLIENTDFVVQRDLVSRLVPVSSWPSVTEGPRAISVVYDAGYETFPAILKRLIKIKAAYYLEAPEAAVSENKITAVSRKTEFGVNHILAQLRVPVSHDDWGQG